MANPFAKLKQDLLAEEMLKQQGGAAIPDAERALLQQQLPMPERELPVDPVMIQQQLAPQLDENALAMAQAPQVAADDSFFSGMAGGFGAKKPSPQEQRRERSFDNRQKAKQSINDYFAPSEPESELFKKIKEKFKGGNIK